MVLKVVRTPKDMAIIVAYNIQQPLIEMYKLE